jgi:hypothetical protein
MKNPPLQPRSTGFSVFMAMPILLSLFLLLSLGLLAALSWFGGSASGDRVRMSFEGSCAEAASETVLARAESIGLERPVLAMDKGTLIVEATLPGLEDDHVAMPRLLGNQGWLEMRDGSTVLASREALKKATLSLDEYGMPYVALQFSPAAHKKLQEHVDRDPKGSLGIYMDDQRLAARPNTTKIVSEDIRIITDEAPTRERMRLATDSMILLSHPPLDCSLGLAALEILDPEKQ